MQNNIFSFTPDKPEVIALKYRTGKHFKKGDYEGFTYTLTNGLVAFFPPAVDKEIQALHIGVNELFMVTKKKNGSGIAWDIERIPQADPEPQVNQPAFSDSVRSIVPEHTTNGNGHSWSPLKRALFSVIEDAVAAEEYAKGKGLSIRFTAEDIRAMANTAVINMVHQYGG